MLSFKQWLTEQNKGASVPTSKQSTKQPLKQSTKPVPTEQPKRPKTLKQLRDAIKTPPKDDMYS